MTRSLAALSTVVVVALTMPLVAQTAPLDEMVRTEQRFAARAKAVGWKSAFLEYFADDAVGFDGERTVSAKGQFRAQPDPPKELQLIWEPRYGDISASGDLGYLTGPVQSINAARDSGQPRDSIYASIWKRESDGTFKVVMDMGVPTPGVVSFPKGFTRAPHVESKAGTASNDAATRSLRDADAALTGAARSGQADAYRTRLATGARLHRPGVMPLVGDKAILAWLASQPAYASGESRFAETAASGDLGYTWGHYAMDGTLERGFYVRAWTRGRDGMWRVALDVLQPQ
jgi:ketosteroid isomerase-like protein